MGGYGVRACVRGCCVGEVARGAEAVDASMDVVGCVYEDGVEWCGNVVVLVACGEFGGGVAFGIGMSAEAGRVWCLGV